MCTLISSMKVSTYKTLSISRVLPTSQLPPWQYHIINLVLCSVVLLFMGSYNGLKSNAYDLSATHKKRMAIPRSAITIITISVFDSMSNLFLKFMCPAPINSAILILNSYS